MMKLLEKMSDRLVGWVAPKAEAEAAACDFLPCRTVFCYCAGSRWYTKLCCKTGTGSSCCNPCRSRGAGCPF